MDHGSSEDSNSEWRWCRFKAEKKGFKKPYDSSLPLVCTWICFNCYYHENWGNNFILSGLWLSNELIFFLSIKSGNCWWNLKNLLIKVLSASVKSIVKSQCVHIGL